MYLLNAVVYLHEKELEDVNICTVLTFSTSHRNTVPWNLRKLRTFSGSDRPKNKNAQPELKN